MALRIDVDMYAGRRSAVRRPASPGGHLWWDRLRGALSQNSPLSPQRSCEQGSTAPRPAVFPDLYDHTERSLRAVGRVVDRVRATHP